MTCSMLGPEGKCSALQAIAQGKDVNWVAPEGATPNLEDPDTMLCIYPTLALTFPNCTTGHCDVTNPTLFDK